MKWEETMRNQIEEMARVIEQSGMLDSYSRCEVVAEELYNEDYRKQSENAVELPCKVGDFVRFKGLETPWKVSAIHIYEEGQPQITITSETEKITCTMTVDEFHMFRCVIADTKMKGGE